MRMMYPIRHVLAAAGAAACSLLVFAAAAGAADTQFHATLRLTSSIPNTPSGGILNLVRPQGKYGKPKTEAVGVFELPPGTKVNLNAVPPCLKDDTTWQIEGPAACPQSFVGTGFATLYSGLGPPIDPLGIDEQWYYAPGQIVALYTLHGQRSPVLKLGHVQIKGATFTAPLDLPPGYPPGSKMSPKATYVTIDRYVGANGAFITTPPTCPDGKWITTVTLHYDDGTIDTVSDATPCQRTAASHRRRRAHRHHRRHHRHKHRGPRR